jgi:general stress protein YciG
MPNTSPWESRPQEADPNKQNEQPGPQASDSGPRPLQAAPQEPGVLESGLASEHRAGGARGTAAMDPQTRQEVARKGGLAVSRNKQHMAEIGRKGGQSVSKNREHMARIGRKGGAASRGHRSES